MKMNRLPCMLALLVLAHGGLLRAESYEALNAAINTTAQRQFALQNENREREERLAKALARGTYDTEEMKATRAKIRKIQDELIDAERLLKTQFEAIPALQAEIKKSKEAQAEMQVLDAKRRALLEQREAFTSKPPAERE